MKNICLFLVGILTVVTTFARPLSNTSTYPEVGKPCPDFILKGVQNYSRTNVSLKDFKRKWLVINCWNDESLIYRETYAYPNIVGREYLPLENELQKKFAGKVQFLVIGYTGSQYNPKYGPDEKDMREDYEKLAKQEKLELPIAFDSVFFHRFDIAACPYCIIIDPNGIVRGISLPLDEKDLEDYMKGRLPEVKKAYRTHEPGSQYLHFREAKYPEIGKPFPTFIFNNVHYYSQSSLSTEDFRGKWLIIDCWDRFCQTCIRYMPYMDTLQHKLADSVQVLMLGWVGAAIAEQSDSKLSDSLIFSLYDELKEKSHLSLPVAYDSVFFDKMDLKGVPDIYIIDPQGILKGITWHLTVEDMKAFFAEKTPSLPKAWRGHDSESPFYRNYPDALLHNVE